MMKIDDVLKESLFFYYFMNHDSPRNRQWRKKYTKFTYLNTQTYSSTKMSSLSLQSHFQKRKCLHYKKTLQSYKDIAIILST